MNILITGARGFVGKNLVTNLYNIKDGKNRTRNFEIGEIYEYDIDTEPALLEKFCEKADFVFNLAGVNRPKDNAEFMAGNFGFASTLLETLKRYENTCPVMLASSIQATLIGRYGESDYGKSKLAGEELFFALEKKQEQRCWYTVSRIFLENGAARIIILLWLHFVIILQMIYRLW